MSENLRTIAVFDFDNTLIKGDSLWPFLAAVAGWPRALLALMEALLMLAFRYLNSKRDPAIADVRTFIKAHLLKRLLGGRRRSDVAEAAGKLHRWRTWNEPMRQALLDHHAQGHHIVIASGGLDLYLPELLKDLPHDGLICTRVETNGDFVTGRMSSGNCVRERKAEMVADFIAQHGPFEDSWGYGNFPHDVPMLGLLKKRIIV